MILALACTLFFAWPTGSSQTSEEKALSKIAPQILSTPSDEKIEFIVVLGERADLRATSSMEDPLERAYFTRDSLYYLAQSSQAPLRNWLTQTEIEHRPFYIVNAIWVRASIEVALAIARRPEVERIDANPIIRTVPDREIEKLNEEALRLAEELKSTSSAALVEPGVNYIRAPEVWGEGFTGQSIVIGGADTGVKWDHPALKNHYRGWNGSAASHDFNWHDSIRPGVGACSRPGDPVPCGGSCGANSTVPCDDNGHGTHTVGTAVGDDGAGNQIGVAPGAKFIACRNMNQGSGAPSTYLECMEFFLAPYPINGTTAQGDPSRRPDITINSWTCPPSEGCAAATLQSAIEAQRAAGIMTVVAAGNEGPNCSTIHPGTSGGPPSHYDAAYTVGAVSVTSGLIASFSSRGPIIIDGSNRVKPDITAPGVSIRSAALNNGYAQLSGTSMATPHVAGAIALLWSAEPAIRRQITLTENLLNGSAVRVNTTDCNSNGTPNNVYGFGRLDVRAAVNASRPAPSPITHNIGANGGSGSVNVAAPPGVQWSAVSNVPWITITTSASGTGNGSFGFLVSANPTIVQRSGSLTVSGKTVTVLQAAGTLYPVSGRVQLTPGNTQPAVTIVFSRVSGTGPVPASVQANSGGLWSQSGFEVGTRYRAIAVQGRATFSPRAHEFSASSSNLDFNTVSRGVLVPGIFLPKSPTSPGTRRGQ